jgi:hypothetical protein
MSKSSLAVKPATQNLQDVTELTMEPRLSDLYNDPTLHALLQSDNLKLVGLQDVITKVQVKLDARLKKL